MSAPAGSSTLPTQAPPTRNDASGQASGQVDHKAGYTATGPVCRLAGKAARELALYDRQGRFVGFATPHGWPVEELPEAVVDGGRRFKLTPIVTSRTAIYSEAPGW